MRIAVISVHGCPLLVPGTREAGGMNVYVAQMSQELARLGIAVDVFTRWHDSDDPPIVELEENLRVIHLEAGGRDPLPKEDVFPHLPEFLRNLEVFQQEQGLQYDLIHSHYWLSGWVGALLGRRWQAPHVVMFHTLGAIKNQARIGENETDERISEEQKIIRSADAIIVASTQEEQLLQRLYKGASTKVRVIPCGVDLDIFRPLDQLAARHELGLNGERVLLFVGRPDPLKGLDILVSVAAQLEHPDGVRLLVVGGEGAPLEFDLQQEDIQNPLVEQQVSFLGRVEHDRLPYFYNAADVCVIPSYYESFGMVALEAMACGTPVVAARVGGLQSTIRDGETGFLIPWHCPEPFVDRLELLLDNEALRQHIGDAARTAAEAYPWSSIATSLLATYESLLNHPTKAASA